MKSIINKLLLKLYLKLHKKYGQMVLEDWHKSRFNTAPHLEALTFTSKHVLNNAERTMIFGMQNGLGGNMGLELSVDGKFVGETTVTLKTIEQRVGRLHYEELYKEHYNKFTQFKPVISMIDDIGAIECKTVLVRNGRH